MKTLLLFAVAATALSASRAHAQGGPPMITDDPGTPGSNSWEINVGWAAQRIPGYTIHSLPLLDANYGVGDRIEITYQAPWGIVSGGGHTKTGLGDTELSVKWRFIDPDSGGWQVSMYPGVEFQDPGSHASLVGLTDTAHTFLMPFQFERDMELIDVNFDVGRIFSTDHSEDGWLGGVVVGRPVAKGFELDVETHVNASPSFNQVEWLVHAGTRIDLSEHLTLMLAYGRDLTNTLLPTTSLLSYAGVQIRLGKGEAKEGDSGDTKSGSRLSPR